MAMTEVLRRIPGGIALVGLPYHNPHSFRHTLTQLGQRLCCTAEEIKAWSQNFGHSGVITTMMNYGVVPLDRQAEIIQHLASVSEADVEMNAVFRKVQSVLQRARDAAAVL